MAKNFEVSVGDAEYPHSHATQEVTVIVRTMLEATGLAATNLSKNRTVILQRTDDAPTHSTSAAAQAKIDVELFKLEAVAHAA